MTASAPVNLRSLDRAGLAGFVRDVLGEDDAVALRIFKEIWQRGVTSFDQMTTLRRSFREALAVRATLDELELARTLRSEDGTIKFLWALESGRTIESVLIPDGERVTLCISSQVGCAMACTFCLTGDLGLVRHLNAAEIACQPFQVQRYLGDSMRITNLVLMGMGEPLHNLEALIPALGICLDGQAMNYSHRRITVSTVGLVPGIAKLAEALPVNLAISLNATTEEHRRRIMPVTRKYSMAELLEQCRNTPLPPGKRITFEYVMFAGENDTLDDAERLRTLLVDIPAKVNLIPYNENPGRPTLKRPSDDVVKAFQHHLVSRGTSCSIRTTRGIDISAACGQLGKTAA